MPTPENRPVARWSATRCSREREGGKFIRKYGILYIVGKLWSCSISHVIWKLSVGA